MAVIDDVLAWAGTLPAWQADAVRRLLEVGDDDLSEASYGEVLALAKADLKLKELPGELAPVPPAPGTFAAASGNPASIKLLSIRDAHHVNIIDSTQTLPFAESGVTVVYGANGSGKSGYSRILKLACRARDKEERILPNVFAIAPAKNPTATLEISQDGTKKDIVWTFGTASDPVLTHITVFDGRCARVITDARNEISYLPYGADIFQRLAAVVTRVKTSIEGEISELVPLHDSGVAAGTPAAEFLETLSATTDAAAVNVATSWSDQDSDELKRLEELLRTSDSASATNEIGRLESLKARIATHRQSAAKLLDDCEPLTNEAIATAVANRDAAQLAHGTAVAERQIAEPLEGVASSDQWQILYQAAKRYSEEVAYPDKEFPYLLDSVCVLCQQPLGEDAIQRFERFKRFMEDATSAVLEEARRVLESLRAKADALAPLFAEALDAVCADLLAVSPQAAEIVRGLHQGVATRKATILNVIGAGAPSTAAEQMPPWPPTPDAVLKELSETLAATIQTISDAAKPAEQLKMAADVAGLRARRALNARKVEVTAYVVRAKRNADLRSAADRLRTQEITRQGTVVIRKNLTPELLKALKQELAALGATRVPISVKPIGAVGETAHEMLLEGATSAAGARPSQILSEGEARVIAIAGFLAELRLAPHANAVVFDDPVSSLDHVFSRRVAARLAKEGLHRQVVIFTHNIALLMEIKDAAMALAQSGTPVGVTVQTIRRGGSASGLTMQGAPWHAMKVGARADALERRAKAIVGMFQDGTDGYNEEAARVYGLLREAWEAFVEEELFNGVVNRFRNSVQTLRLMEVEISDVDCHQLELNMSKASTWMTGHDKSKTLHDDRPAPNELLADIDVLRSFAKAVKDRRSTTKKRREAQLTPTATSP